MKIFTVKDNVIVEPAEGVERNGLIIPVSNENIIQGKIIAIGKNVETTKEEDTVIINKQVCAEIEVSGKKYLVTQEKNVLAILG
jgi:co-chaperonin GroES (HSP10)